MLHYFAKSFFSPVLIIPTILLDNVTVMITSDLPHEAFSLHCTLHVLIYKWNSFQPVKNFTIATELAPFSSVIVIDNVPIYEIAQVQSVLNNCGYGWEIKSRCFVIFNLYNSNGEKISPDAFLFPERLTQIKNLKEAVIELKEIREITMNESDPLLPKSFNQFEITISTNTISLFVWLDVGNIKGKFSDNGFHMIKPVKRINFTCWENCSADKISKSLNIMTIKGYYKGIPSIDMVRLNSLPREQITRS